jgi:hypothetical protein
VVILISIKRLKYIIEGVVLITFLMKCEMDEMDEMESGEISLRYVIQRGLEYSRGRDLKERERETGREMIIHIVELF